MKNQRAHLKALKSNFELICLYSLAALSADFVWLLNDIFANGFSINYFIVGLGLLIAIFGIIRILFKCHKQSVREINHELLAEKLELAKQKIKHNRRVK